MKKNILTILLIVLFGITTSLGQDIPKPMSPSRLVNDFAGLFTDRQTEELEKLLIEFEKETSNQIAIVTVTDLGGYAPSDYALAILRQWGVGQKGKDNGVVMLLKPRNDTRGEIDIRSGYGLEGALPDSRTGRIIDREMIPSLRDGDYYQAAYQGSVAIMDATRGEYKGDEENVGVLFSLFQKIGPVIIFILIIVLMSKKGGHNGGDDGGSGGSRRSGLPPIFWGGGFGSGGGRSSGGSGGGFGGFGGGSGGGGGAGRSF